MHLVLSPPEGAPTETITGRGIVDQSTTTSPAGVAKNPTPKLTTAPVTPQHDQQLNPGMKRARTPEEAGTLLERSASHPLLSTPPRGMNVTAVEFGHSNGTLMFSVREVEAQPPVRQARPVRHVALVAPIDKLGTRLSAFHETR